MACAYGYEGSDCPYRPDYENCPVDYCPNLSDQRPDFSDDYGDDDIESFDPFQEDIWDIDECEVDEW